IIDRKKGNNNGLLLDRNENTNTKGNIIRNKKFLKDIENIKDRKQKKKNSYTINKKKRREENPKIWTEST
ncbi:MAG: hypothetical protein ACRD8K_01040, partial [Nitrososphaeraceae archaeon]